MKHEHCRHRGLRALGVLLLAVVSFAAAQTTQPAYLNPSLPIERRIDDLLARMSVRDKVAQVESDLRPDSALTFAGRDDIGGIGPVLRPLGPRAAALRANEIQNAALGHKPLGIPVLIHDEALHGLIGDGATSFPQAIGLAATWDTALVARVASVIGRQARSRGVRQVLSPVINIARDVRWGRVEETYGEDPYLSSRMGVSFCRAIETQGVVTTPKHFIANVGDGGRDSYPAALSERELREVYFPPFEACISEAHAQSVMASYNSLNGIPCSADPWLLTSVLRREWGFDGIVVSDYGSVSGVQNMHFVAATEQDAARKCLAAGLDVELPEVYIYGKPLLEGVQTGAIPMRTLDAAVRNVLRVKFRLGLFERLFSDPDEATRANDTPEQRALAREAARKAVVLLKNDGAVLPLGTNISSVAVVGPRADGAWLGGYSGTGMKTVSILEGIKSRIGPHVTVRYEKGCDVGAGPLPPVSSTNLVPTGAKPNEHGLRGEYFANKDLAGTPALTRIDRQIDFEWAMGTPDSSLPSDRFSVRWSGKLIPAATGMYRLGIRTDDGVRLWLDGRLLVDSWMDRGATPDVRTVPLEAGRPYDLRIEYYENTGWSSASLGWELERNTEERLKPAVDAVRRSDVAVVVVGISEGEGSDRSHLELPGDQEDLIRAVAATGKPTVVVLVAGSAVTMAGWIDRAGAILDAWYPGEEGGNAVADVLFGDVNPGGRLPLTFPQFVGQVPLYYDHKPTGRGNDYSDMNGKPLYPFGHGLSYTTFSYGSLTLSSAQITPDGKVKAAVRIRNTGAREGDEVVQLYLHRLTASVTQPLKLLKGFQRISLKPGEEQSVSFTLDRSNLSLLDATLRSVVEPGTVEVMIGSSSDDIRARGRFEITEGH